MKVNKDNFLEFDLKNGWRYQEKGPRLTTNTEFIRLGFKEYKKILDLSSFKMNKTADSAFKDNYRMMSARQLSITIDSLKKMDNYFLTRAKNEVSPYLTFSRYGDTGWIEIDKKSLHNVKNFDDILPDSARNMVRERAVTQVNSVKPMVDLIEVEYAAKKKELNNFMVEWHRKFSLSFACVVLFLIGAPLGSIIRKGGLGTPLVFAVIFFIIFHLLNTFGDRFVKINKLSPIEGMWLSTAVLVPIGIFLTYKAMRDSELFNQEYYHRALKKLRTFLADLKKQKV
jgi:lipopolysaccharide export system permease protein